MHGFPVDDSSTDKIIEAETCNDFTKLTLYTLKNGFTLL